jgi:hypothetical protein
MPKHSNSVQNIQKNATVSVVITGRRRLRFSFQNLYNFKQRAIP